MSRESRLDWETGSKVPTGKVKSRANDQIWNLSNSLRSDKSNPVIRFRLGSVSEWSSQKGVATHLLFSSLKQISIVQEIRLHLVDTAWSHKNEVEYGEESQLKVERAISNHPESKSAEESSKNVQVDLVPHVVLPYD